MYSWWSSNHAYGAARAAAESGVPSVSRIHGYELYPEQDRLGRIPFQHSGLAGIGSVYSVSRAGADYLSATYPDVAPRVQVAYLGVDCATGPGGPSTDGTFRILSCSSCVPIKRVDLLASSLVRLLQDHPDLHFTWTHIGDGPTLGDVQRTVNAQPGLAERCTFTGFMPSSDVRELMASEPFDVFVNVSSSEGLPVTLMEAASSGIPMIATAIGGNPEIVDDSCGRLLPANPTAEQVAEALLAFSRVPPSARQELREGSRARWADRFSAERNYAQFGEFLDGLAEQ